MLIAAVQAGTYTRADAEKYFCYCKLLSFLNTAVSSGLERGLGQTSQKGPLQCRCPEFTQCISVYLQDSESTRYESAQSDNAPDGMPTLYGGRTTRRPGSRVACASIQRLPRLMISLRSPSLAGWQVRLDVCAFCFRFRFRPPVRRVAVYHQCTKRCASGRHPCPGNSA